MHVQQNIKYFHLRTVPFLGRFTSRVLMFITYALLHSFFDFLGYGDRCDALLQYAKVNGSPKGYLSQQIVLPLESLHPLAHISFSHALAALIPQQISPFFTPSDHKGTGQ